MLSDTARRALHHTLPRVAALALCLSSTRAHAQATAQAAAHAAASSSASPQGYSTREFAALAARFSDAGGYFDTDNLISNEPSLLHPLNALDSLNVRGGVYLGVGPDQNFNYIAQVVPRVAFIADIRRDNMLLLLLFKALFHAASDRQEFLALWLGKPVPPAPRRRDMSVDSLVAWAERTPSNSAGRTQAQQRVRALVNGFGIPLSTKDRETIARFHGEFMRQGTALRFTTIGRPPQRSYPTLGQLLRERDKSGRQRSYLSSDSLFGIVQSMQRRNLIIPLVGDLAGPTVLPKLAPWLREQRETISVLYTSNVEDYLLRYGTFRDFVRSVRALPRRSNSIIIRSWFGGPGTHPQQVPGYFTAQLVERIDAFATDPSVDRVASYRQLVMRVP
ncbi:hypothetical protein [Gemmatimonas sp. UBA7669]|uniref:LIC_10091 family protein n=1 Tax=Gemmatimonas sp. UBA7669 TaxID=1946568 RepID=UPI0025C1BFD2|nr:hypothetical protein [Gemmatimonas sp. UBA7669]